MHCAGNYQLQYPCGSGGGQKVQRLGMDGQQWWQFCYCLFWRWLQDKVFCINGEFCHQLTEEETLTCHVFVGHFGGLCIEHGTRPAHFWYLLWYMPCLEDNGCACQEQISCWQWKTFWRSVGGWDSGCSFLLAFPNWWSLL